MFCRNCGAQIDDRAEICPKCGVRVNPQSASPATYDAPNAGFAVLGFFFPLIGLILYLVWKDQYPLKAKSCGKGALIGVIVYVAFVILYIILIASVAGCAAAKASSRGTGITRPNGCARPIRSAGD